MVCTRGERTIAKGARPLRHRLAAALALGALLGTGCLEDGPVGSAWRSIDVIVGPMQPELRNRAGAAGPFSGRLRLATFNVALGEDVTALADSLRASAALRELDLLLVQEIERHPGEERSRADRLAELLDRSYLYAPARLTDDGGTHGLAVLSRWPLEDAQVMELPYFELGLVSSQRIALAVTALVTGRPLRGIDVHLDTRLNLRDRLAQLRPVVTALPDQVVVGGDFNSNPFLWLDRTMPMLPAYTVSSFDQADAIDEYMRALGYATPTEGSGSTFNLPAVPMRLDSVFVRGLPVESSGVDRSVVVSDHFPLWVELDWK